MSPNFNVIPIKSIYTKGSNRKLQVLVTMSQIQVHNNSYSTHHQESLAQSAH